MSSGRPRRGTASEELFLESPSTSGPPVEALRIHKKLGSQADKSQESLASSSQNPIAQRRPTFPAGSSSSPRSGSPGLPYPDRPAAERVALQQQQQHGGLPYPDRERPPRKDSSSPYYDGSSTPPLSAVSSSSSQPGRHVSVVLSDAYPTPPAFRHREGRPARLAKNNNESQSQQPGPKDEPRPPSPEINMNPFPQFHQQYWPPPSRMTSTSTTAARRGSPPPPETPATATNEHPPIQFGGGAVEGRRGSPATSGPQGRNSPRNNSNAYISASQAPPAAHYQPQAAAQSSAPVEAPPRRPWTPTETPGSYPHGPPTVWHGTGGQTEAQPANGQEPSTQAHNAQAQQALESDFQRMNMSASPPPSYASLSQTAAAGMMAHHHAQGSSSRGASNANPTTTQGYPDEKHTVVLGAAAPQDQLPYNNHTSHPAFHNEHAEELQQRSSQQPQSQSQPQPQNQPRDQPQPQSQPQQPQHAHIQEHHPTQQFTQHETQQHYTPPPGVGPSSPPPLPEGWMAHLDQASGQYYYIHIPTSRTQWEFPVQETIIPPPVSSPPQSTTGSYANIPPLGSPGFPPQHSSYSDPMLGMNSPPVLQHTNSFPMHTPPPHMPLFGIAMYKVAPVNGEYFGPYLRYTNMDIERGIWLGSIMLVTSHPQAPTVHLHQSHDLSPNPRQLKANPIYSHKNWTFYRYDIDIAMGDMGMKWTYAITSHLGCTRYEFLVAGRTERNWRFIAHSCNDFSLSVKSEEKSRLGGVGFMWKDVMQKHIETGGFHAQIGGGDQIYADRIWREIPSLKDWLEIKGKENRKNAAWTPGHEDEVNHAYFHFYSSHFDQAHLREAWAEIPHLLQIDDHDIFDGFGSYPEYMQFSNMFKNIGRIAVHWYLLFQHHTTLDILHASPDDRDLFTVTGTGWHFVKYLGPGIAVVGIDTRSERNPHQVLAGPTYQGLFPRIATLPPSVQHCILMLAVPIIYPRLQTAEHVVNTVATGKKAVTGTYNLLGKVVGSAAGVVGAKDVVGSGFQGVKKAFGKSGLMSSVVSVFGEVDLLDDLRDHWTHESKDLERTYFIRTLQGIAKQRGMRVTFLSGDVHCCGAGLVHDPNKPSDHKTMYQIITSAIVNVPPPNMVLKMLHNNKPLYVPQNGMRSTGMPSDTKEDMIEIFQTDVNGQVRELKKLMGRRNYTIFCAYDAQQQAQPVHYDTNVGPGGNGPLSLAVDFIIQGEGIYSQTAKYGPVVIPRVNY